MPTVAFNWSLGGQTAVNVLEFQRTAEFLLTQAPGMANEGVTLGQAIARDFMFNFAALLTDQIVLDTVTEEGITGPETNPVNLGGTAPDAASAISNTILIRKNATGGRNGRMYLPGLVETGVDGSGRLEDFYIAQLQPAIDAWQVAIEGQGIIPRVKRSDNSVNPVISFTVDPIIGTQRRRIRR